MPGSRAPQQKRFQMVLAIRSTLKFSHRASSFTKERLPGVNHIQNRLHSCRAINHLHFHVSPLKKCLSEISKLRKLGGGGGSSQGVHLRAWSIREGQEWNELAVQGASGRQRPLWNQRIHIRKEKEGVTKQGRTAALCPLAIDEFCYFSVRLLCCVCIFQFLRWIIGSSWPLRVLGVITGDLSCYCNSQLMLHHQERQDGFRIHPVRLIFIKQREFPQNQLWQRNSSPLLIGFLSW